MSIIIPYIKIYNTFVVEFIASLAEEIDHLPKEAHCRDIVLLAKDNEMTSTITMLEGIRNIYYKTTKDLFNSFP